MGKVVVLAIERIFFVFCLFCFFYVLVAVALLDLKVEKQEGRLRRLLHRI